MTRPDGNTGSYFMWLDGNGNSYAPGASVPADVTELTVQWTAPTYTVTLNAGDGTINSGNVTPTPTAWAQHSRQRRYDLHRPHVQGLV